MKTIKLIIVLFLLTTLVGCSKDVQEEVKYEKLEYSTVEDLFQYVTVSSVSYQDINNIAYTIREDDVLDEYQELAYEVSYSEYNKGEKIMIWLAYYYAETEQYCDEVTIYPRFPCNIDGVEVAGDLYTHLPAIIIHDANEMVEKDGKFIFSPIKVYPVEKTETLLQAIDNAYIISQGEGTPGYEEAMNWSYEVAVSNGSSKKIDTFKDGYLDEIVKYEPQLQEMQGKDIDWLVEHYDEYSEVFDKIESALDILD